MTCNNCGYDVGNAKKCKYCGTTIDYTEEENTPIEYEQVTYEPIKSRTSYFKGIIGGILGGIVGSIPMYLLRTVGFMSSITSYLIAMASFYGYRLFHGREDDNLYKIISIITYSIVLSYYFVVIPFLSVKLSLSLNIDINIASYYVNYLKTSMIDIFVSFIFTYLGVKSAMQKL